MRTYLDCIPCFVRQALEAARMVTDDAGIHEKAMREALRMSGEFSFEDPPPVMGGRIHKLVKQLSGSDDPYASVKGRSNHKAMDIAPKLEALVAESDDPFETALRLAIAGNIIDYGVVGHTVDDNLMAAMEEALSVALDRERVEALRRDVAGARRILYILDNAGEIVFDAIFIKTIGPEKVTAAVRSAPIINDVTMKDAVDTGLTYLVPVIDSGSELPGTVLAQTTPDFRARYDAADVIIAKGQGNYETLNEESGNIYLLLRVKCAVAARDLDQPIGSIVIAKARG